MSAPGFWATEGFEDRYDAWVESEQPGHEHSRLVLRWLLELADDPYRGVRETSFAPNYWRASIPGSMLLTPDGQTVVSAFWYIREDDRVVRLDMLATLTLPL